MIYLDYWSIEFWWKASSNLISKREQSFRRILNCLQVECMKSQAKYLSSRRITSLSSTVDLDVVYLAFLSFDKKTSGCGRYGVPTLNVSRLKQHQGYMYYVHCCVRLVHTVFRCIICYFNKSGLPRYIILQLFIDSIYVASSWYQNYYSDTWIGRGWNSPSYLES